MPSRPGVIVILAACLVAGAGCRPAAPEVRYVGAATCSTCHAAVAAQWQRSHHALAMQEPTDTTVLGDFDDATFTYAGTTTTFSKQEGRFRVRTDGPDGRLHDYPVAYTFGATPLQQYLLPLPGGRLQALSIAWDSRPARTGGQRWFHLYPGEAVTAGDLLHWTGPFQNWNHLCADCHSTNLKKNYDPQRRVFETTWTDLNVACEACHGPASAHLGWAAAPDTTARTARDRGLVVDLGVDAWSWRIDPATGIAARTAPRPPDVLIETCSRCHARRTVLTEDPPFGTPFLDTYRPDLLEAPLYHADGQIRDEVYVYGSFLQSKMYRAGVTCINCHEPHGLQLRATGNALCGQCHSAANYDTTAHHRHAPGTPGAQCVNCHMPATTYMQVDPRRDHGFKVPRPDLTEPVGVPNACNGCHTGQSSAWAARHIAQWFGPARPPAFAPAFHAAETGTPDAGTRLLAVAQDSTWPVIVRASALQRLAPYLDPTGLPAVRRAVHHEAPLIRLAAVALLERLPPEDRWAEAAPLLRDPLRAVRLEAARVLAPVAGRVRLTGAGHAALDAAVREYSHALTIHADRPSAQVSLGLLYAAQGHFEAAEAAYRTALSLAPGFTQASVNLADLYRMQQRDDEGRRVLEAGLAVTPDDAALHHTLGLLLVRLGRSPEALEALGKAHTLQPENTRYRYVYAVALNGAGRPDKALALLEATPPAEAANRDLLLLRAMLYRDRGRRTDALSLAHRILALAPSDPQARQLVAQLEQE